MQRIRIGFAMLVGVLPAACVVGPEYQRPDIDAGNGWSEPVERQDRAIDLETWWSTFEDPTLTRLVETALAQNLDIREAGARVTEARALRDVVAGGRYPAVNLSAGVTRLRQSENGPLPINQIPGI